MIVLITDNAYLKIALSDFFNKGSSANLFSYGLDELCNIAGCFKDMSNISLVFDFSSDARLFSHKYFNLVNEIINYNSKNRIIILDWRLKHEFNFKGIFFINKKNQQLLERISELSTKKIQNDTIPSIIVGDRELHTVKTYFYCNFDAYKTSRKIKVSIKTVSAHKCNFKNKFGFCCDFQFYNYLKLLSLQ